MRTFTGEGNVSVCSTNVMHVLCSHANLIGYADAGLVQNARECNANSSDYRPGCMMKTDELEQHRSGMSRVSGRVSTLRQGNNPPLSFRACSGHVLPDWPTDMGQYAHWPHISQHVVLTQGHVWSAAGPPMRFSESDGRAMRALTNVCLQVTQTMLFAASLTLSWLLADCPALAALRSRFCCALAPCDHAGHGRM